MPYNKTDWVPGQAVITTDELNNLETQYDSVVDDITVSGSPVEAALSATYVVFRNHDGTPVAAPKVVAITLTADGTDIDNIAVYDSLEEVGA